jgi:hypothetical protein
MLEKNETGNCLYRTAEKTRRAGFNYCPVTQDSPVPGLIPNTVTLPDF